MLEVIYMLHILFVVFFPFQIVIEGVVGVSWQGDIAIDDTSLTPGPCPTPSTCDFEVDDCQFIQDSNDQFDWTRHANSTASQNTGPTTDHTTRNGYGERDCLKLGLLILFNNLIP